MGSATARRKLPPSRFPTVPRESPLAFTLIEILVSISILTVILLVTTAIANHVSRTWRFTNSKIQEFSGARTAFENITRRMSQATLNTYWDYVDKNGNGRTYASGESFVPASYGRQSELRFITGFTKNLGGDETKHPLHAIFFQAPIGYCDENTTADCKGLNNLLNSCGYFVEFSSDKPFKPSFLTSLPEHYRFRLMEYIQPSNLLTLYNKTSGNPTYDQQDWFSDAFKTPGTAPTHVIAENVIALIVQPKRSAQEDSTGTAIAPNYAYDSAAAAGNASHNQLPPVVQVTIVAIDEASASRLEAMNGTSMPKLVGEGQFTVASNYASDLKASANGSLQSLEDTLIRMKLNYRIFTTNVNLRAAKWSDD